MRNPATSDHRFSRYGPVLAGVVAAICACILVLLAWRNQQSVAHREARAELHAEADLVESLVRQRLVEMELIMRGAASLMAGEALPSDNQWQSYVTGLDLAQQYPSVAGLGYGAYIERVDLARFQRDWKTRTGELINIQPWGARAEYAPVIYMTPMVRVNQAIVGTDMYAEANRHEAMERSMESGRPWLSAPIELYLDDGAPALRSMTFYTPVYRRGDRPASIAARRAEMAGWVYMPFRVQQFVDMALKSAHRKMKLKVSDASDDAHLVMLAEDRNLPSASIEGTIVRSLPVYGRKLRLDFYDDGETTGGRSAWVLWAGLPLALAVGLIAFLLARTQARAQVLAHDMTRAYARSEDRIRALNRTLEGRVEARTRELSEANRQLESFAYTVSHDLRAPLRAIDGFSRLLGDRHAAALDDTARGYLTHIRAGAQRMDDLIGAILSISRVSRGDLQRQRIDLSALAGEIVDELRIGDPTRSVEVEIAPGVHAEGDPSLVRILMQNLIGNAWKFTRDRHPAHIRFARDGEGRCFVEDDGVGFDPAHAGKLFQPFQRLHPEAEFVGHGIGLATVQRIIERHGGSLQAQGEVGRGARFTFTLPDAAMANGHDPHA